MRLSGHSKKNSKENITGYILILPWLFGFLLLYLVPMFSSVYYSFTNYNLLNEPRFIGLDNYKRMFLMIQPSGNPWSYNLLCIALVPLRLILLFYCNAFEY